MRAKQEKGRIFEQLTSLNDIMLDLKLEELFSIIWRLRKNISEIKSDSRYDFMATMAVRKPMWDLRKMIRQEEILLPHTLEQLNRILVRRNWQNLVAVYENFEQSYELRPSAELTEEDIEKKQNEAKDIFFRVNDMWGITPPSDLLSELEQFMEALESDFKSIHLIELTEEEAKYYEGKEAFDSSIIAEFPEIEADVKEAALCFGVARYTACVFHLMRAMEIGVQMLAHDIFGLDLQKPNGSDYEWSNLVEMLEKQHRDRQKANTPKTTKDKEIWAEFGHAISHFANVKTDRHRVCHSRDLKTSEYSKTKTADIYSEVKKFFEQLIKLKNTPLPGTVIMP